MNIFTKPLTKLLRLGCKLRTYVALAMLAGPALMVGCYGSFPLTHAVYNFNGTVTHNQLGQTIIMWIMVIIPVYEFSIVVGDAIILNLVEFWTGSPVHIQSSRPPAANEIALVRTADPAVAILKYPGPDGRRLEATVRKTSASHCDVVDQGGKLVGMMTKSANGDLNLTADDGSVVTTITVAQMQAMTAAR